MGPFILKRTKAYTTNVTPISISSSTLFSIRSTLLGRISLYIPYTICTPRYNGSFHVLFHYPHTWAKGPLFTKPSQPWLPKGPTSAFQWWFSALELLLSLILPLQSPQLLLLYHQLCFCYTLLLSLFTQVVLSWRLHFYCHVHHFRSITMYPFMDTLV